MVKKRERKKRSKFTHRKKKDCRQKAITKSIQGLEAKIQELRATELDGVE